MSDDRSDLEEAIRLLRGWGGRHFAPYVEAETRDFLARHPEKPKLLGCPFCGSSDVIFAQKSPLIVRGEPLIVQNADPGRAARCCDCGVQTSWWSDDTSAAFAWNRRATPASGPLSGGKTE